MNQNNNVAKDKADSLLASAVIAEEQELADTLIAITQKHGKFNSDDMGVWAGYESAAENENREIGVTCANCILYEGGSTCKIIDAQVEPGGYCRFALIPDGVVKAKSEVEESTEEMSFNCPVCDNGCACSVGPCNCPPTCGCPCRGDAVVIVSAASRRAPKKDRIYGSKKNKKGSASGGKKIVFSAKTEKALANKVKEHNEKAPAGRKATLGQLKAVYRRGAGAFSSSHRPGKTRDQWAMARVNAYLKLLKSGRPANPNYKQDNDLLPKAHPKSTNSIEAMTAAALANQELYVTLFDEEEYQSPEHAIVAFAEYSGLGYETIPAFRAAWLRAVDDHEIPFERAKDLAVNLYSSKDADLLPKVQTNTEALVAVGKGWRSAKAKIQRRDRYGRFAEMGGGFSFAFKKSDGSVSRATGEVIGQTGKEDIFVEVRGNKDLPDGVYSVPSSKGETVKAVISNDALKQADVKREDTKVPSGTPVVDQSEMKRYPTYEQMYESNEKRLVDKDKQIGQWVNPNAPKPSLRDVGIDVDEAIKQVGKALTPAEEFRRKLAEPREDFDPRNPQNQRLGGPPSGAGSSSAKKSPRDMTDKEIDDEIEKIPKYEGGKFDRQKELEEEKTKREIGVSSGPGAAEKEKAKRKRDRLKKRLEKARNLLGDLKNWKEQSMDFGGGRTMLVYRGPSLPEGFYPGAKPGDDPVYRPYFAGPEIDISELDTPEV